MQKIVHRIRMIMKYTKEQVLEATKGSGGIVRGVAQRLGCEWHTAEKYINRWEVTRRAFQDEKETLLDKCEHNIASAIEEKDIGTSKWFLLNKGKDRGYGERAEITDKNYIDMIDVKALIREWMGANLTVVNNEANDSI